MSNDNPTINLQHAVSGRHTLEALARALADGRDLSKLTIDLSNPEQCRFGAYTLVEHIGAGGVGLVYRAHQASLGRDVAIKILNLQFAGDNDALARFRFEARSAAALNHPNIVQILEIGQSEDVSFIAMQLVRGESLASRIQRERMDTAAAVALMLQLCDAVGYAHRLRLLHLDLKPANILIDERGEPMVADFGLARRMDSDGFVEAQEVSGTPGYMAPEQALIKDYKLSIATDIYALGAILYELLCGQPPHGRGAAADVMQRALAGAIPRPRVLNPDVPKDLEAICLQCMKLRAADRYPSVAALAEDLHRYAGGLEVSVRSPTHAERLQRWYAREPKFAATLGVLLLFAAGSGVMFANLYRNAEHERVSAEGLVRVMMSQTPERPNTLLPKTANFNIPVIDCSKAAIDCAGGIQTGTSGDVSLPVALKEHYLESLRAYVPKIATWGDPHLSAQLAQTLDDVQNDLYAPRRAEAAAATGTADGFLFAYLLARNGDQTSLDRKTVMGWFDSALAAADQPWQAQILAQSCDQSRPACLSAIERFRVLDPDNAAAWMMAMPGDPGDEADQRLLHAASAAHLDHHATAFLDDAVAFGTRVMPTLDPALRLTPAGFAHNVWNETGGFDYPTDYCRHTFTDRDVAAVNEACRRIIAKVDASMQPTVLDEVIAASMARKMAKNAASQSGDWARLRNARWIYSVWRQLPPGTESDEVAQIQAIHDHGELAYVKSLVAAAHLPADAPKSFDTKEPPTWKRRAAVDTAGKPKQTSK